MGLLKPIKKLGARLKEGHQTRKSANVATKFLKSIAKRSIGKKAMVEAGGASLRKQGQKMAKSYKEGEGRPLTKHDRLIKSQNFRFVKPGKKKK